MRYLRHFILWFSAIALHTSLFATVLTYSSIQLIEKPQAIKQTIVQTGVYDDFVPGVIVANVESATGSGLPLDDKNIQSIILTSFTPESFQKQTEGALDDVFKWLSGEHEILTFALDFTAEKDLMVARLSEYAVARLADKPDCTADELSRVMIFRLECQPPGVYESMVRENVTHDLNESSLLKKMIVSQETLPKNASGQSIDKTYSFATKVYQRRFTLLYILCVIFTLSAAAYVLARRPLRHGIRALGHDFLSNGVLLIMFTVIFGFILPKYTSTYALSGGGPTDAFNRVVNAFVIEFDKLIISAMVLVVGIGLLLLTLERFTRYRAPFESVKRKSGVATSVAKKPKKKPASKKAKKVPLPPLQTSETKIKKKPKKKTTNKYKKMGL